MKESNTEGLGKHPVAFQLDKEATSYNDVFDAFRLAMRSSSSNRPKTSIDVGQTFRALNFREDLVCN